MKKLIFISLIAFAVMSSCHNSSWNFPDHEYTTVYFSYQYPVRTIVLGEDQFDTTLDNEYKCMIMATTGGVYKNKNNIEVGIKVDNSLCDGLVYENTTTDIMPMPSNYYTLASDKIIIPKGKLMGGVEVQLTDAFFADPLAMQRTYVIPMYMTEAHKVDSILRGIPYVDNPNRNFSDDWKVMPKDFTMYAVKYINKWHAVYLRRGEDVVTGKNGNTALDKTIVRREKYVEHDEVCKINTRSLKEADITITSVGEDGRNREYTLILTFDDSDKCTISSNSPDYTATGTGSFVKRGEKKSWANKDRDAIYLDYKVEFSDRIYSTTDTLVLRDRGTKAEWYRPVFK